jgi:hypothetical protein
MADLKKEVAGQPIWLWGVAAVVVVGGYLYIRSKSSSAAPSAGTGTGTGGGGKDTSSFKETIKDWQSSPTKPSPKPKPTVNPGGPERKWLIHKTGSQHPWSFLSRHHERVQVGPTGSRKIVGK